MLWLPANRRNAASKRDGEPNLIKHCAVLAAVNIASRRLRRWSTTNADRRSARLTLKIQAGTKKRLSSRTKKLKDA
jgi:hypothetical protein